MGEQKIGIVTHYFGKIGVAAIEITNGELHVGDTIHVKGHSTDFTQRIDSMQVEHQAVQIARRGDSVGLKVAGPAREHDDVYKETAD